MTQADTYALVVCCPPQSLACRCCYTYIATARRPSLATMPSAPSSRHPRSCSAAVGKGNCPWAKTRSVHISLRPYCSYHIDRGSCGRFSSGRRRRRRQWRRTHWLMDMGRKPYSEEAKEKRRIKTMEALVPRETLDIDNDDNQINHTARRFNQINHTGVRAPAFSIGWSTTAAASLPQSWSSFAHTAPTMGEGWQRTTPGQRATPNQQATPQRTSRWMTVLTAIGRSLSNSRLLWLDFVILSMEELLNVLHTIRVAAGRVDPATVGSDASAAAAAPRATTA